MTSDWRKLPQPWRSRYLAKVASYMGAKMFSRERCEKLAMEKVVEEMEKKESKK